jgi:nucleoside-diphosphate-sugar epimerase
LDSFLILGKGYTGSALEISLKELYPGAEVNTTTRAGANSTHAFDTSDPSHWESLPAAKIGFITLPVDSQSVPKLWPVLSRKIEKIVLVSSTGFFKIASEDETVNEQSPVDLDNDRVKAEEWIRGMGGVIVHASGIYGPSRNPLDWLKSGRVGLSSKFINLIHVQDLCQILIAAALKSGRSRRWIASDQNPYRWSELIPILQETYRIGEIAEKESSRASKRVDSSKTREELQIKLRYPDVLAGLKQIVP